MARPKRLTQKERREWEAQFHLAEQFYNTRVEPTRQMVDAYRTTTAHWPMIHHDALGNIVDHAAWPYDAITANLIYAGYESLAPRVLMRAPKIRVKPASRVTGRFARLEQSGGESLDRFIQAAIIQQIMNWRIREFDFKTQLDRMHFDDYFRGFGGCRHGYLAEISRLGPRSQEIQTETHQHVRAGWPFAVHQPIDLYRSDTLARDPDARQWVAFGKMWRLDDLKADPRFTIPEGVTLRPTHIAGRHDHLNLTADERKFFHRFQNTLGRIEVWEVWDIRTHRIIHWVGEWNQDIGIEDWPQAFAGIDGLPDTLLMTHQSNEGMDPISEPEIVWDLQQHINKLLSILLVSAKRSVPVIAANENAMDDEEMEKLTDAEILEIISTQQNPKDAIAVLNLTPNLVPVIQALSSARDLYREITGQSPMSLGNRINVESAAEALQVGEGSDTRVVKRASEVQRAATRMARKDWQILSQSFTEDQIVDIAEFGDDEAPLLKLTPEQARMEYDFDVVIGSTQPMNDQKMKRDVLAFIQASQSRPDLINQFNPRGFARLLSYVFDFDEFEVMASQDAAFQQGMTSRMREAFSATGAGAGGNGAAGRPATGGVGAGLDALKPGTQTRQ